MTIVTKQLVSQKQCTEKNKFQQQLFHPKMSITHFSHQIYVVQKTSLSFFKSKVLSQNISFFSTKTLFSPNNFVQQKKCPPKIFLHQQTFFILKKKKNNNNNNKKNKRFKKINVFLLNQNFVHSKTFSTKKSFFP